MHTLRAGIVRLGLVAVLFLSTASYGATTTMTATLNGANENPANGSTGTGSTTVIYDSIAHTLSVSVSFSGLGGNTTAAHIHCCIAAPFNVGVATTTPTFSGFPLGVTSGTYSNVLNLTLASSYNPTFVTANGGTVAGAEAALAAAFASGTSYLNIHTTTFPGGEIRSFLPVTNFVVENNVPSLSRLGLGLLVALLAIAAAFVLRK